MIDHTGIYVSDISHSKHFYSTVLDTLGYKICLDFGKAIGFGLVDKVEDDPGGDFWITEKEPSYPRNHIAFRAKTHAQVDAFYTMALKNGATSNGAPGYRENYHPNYYAAFVKDPDGYNIEAVCHHE
ncbi:VOC family protein [Vibrio tritonius]|uniref:VOC family protein n=1 Tax=Vibrio tritonius TaxID=1435069 RepID=A0ABS7YX52_9VIBR|nr:VOC family protein [Vibrio tritonius]MCA2018789.1 VOC family protein [Vibrio tritonius]